MSTLGLALMILFCLKHFLADYPLQNPYMLGKFKKFPDFILPLTLHCLTHGVFTFLISFAFTQDLEKALLLSQFDMLTHFAMDRIKASPKILGRYEALSKREFMLIGAETLQGIDSKETGVRLRSNTLFWWSLGLDQMVHAITDVVIAYSILN